jgi:hypothetical protein
MGQAETWFSMLWYGLAPVVKAVLRSMSPEPLRQYAGAGN